MSEKGFIKLHRQLLEHPIWQKSTPEQKVILITLICMANHEPNRWEWNGEIFTVKRGQMVTSLESIKSACGKGISTQNIRTALVRFEKLGFLTNESTKSGRLITIEKYSKWQDVDSETNKGANKDLTKTSQRPNKDLTPNKNDKNDKNDKKIDIYSRERAEIISYLNEICGTYYKPNTSKSKQLIHARLKEGFSVDDFKAVIYKKAKQWKDDPKMCKYLRPETLFGQKFEGYLNEKTAQTFEERLMMT